MTKIGIFGGSFDPIHIAHLILAECAGGYLGLDQVRFIPTAVSPFKQQAAPIDAKHRLTMISLAIGGNTRLFLDDREVVRGGVSYTIDTIKSLKAEMPDAEFWLLMGADSLDSFDKWKSPAELLSMTKIGVMIRPVAGRDDTKIDWSVLKPFLNGKSESEVGREIRAPLLQISSTVLRQQVKEGHSIRYQVPSAVEAYIRQHQLYR